MINTSPKIDKYDTHKKWGFTKMTHLAIKSYLPMTELNGFKREFLNLLYDSDSWSWVFKVNFFPL